MTDKNYTHMTMVIDRSGSMQAIADDAEGGINKLIKDQREVEGKMTFTLVEFDQYYDVIYDGVDIKEVSDYKLIPRGMTGLLDATGNAINSTGNFLKNMPEDDRPENVLFVIVTDGHENASIEFRSNQIKKMIEHQTNVYNWDFTYIGANVDAITVGDSIGVTNSINYAATSQSTSSMYAAANNSIKKIRGGEAKSLQANMSKNY